MAGYTYGGTRPDLPLDCRGGYGASGAEWHRRRGEPTCEKCKASRNHANALRRAGLPVPRIPAPSRVECGTNSGYQRHMREGTLACDPCLEAHAEAERNWCRKTVDTHSE